MRFVVLFTLLLMLVGCGGSGGASGSSESTLPTNAAANAATNAVNLAESYSGEMNGVSVTFNYPEGWGLRDEDGLVYVYSGEAVIEASDDQVFDPGERAIQIVILDTSDDDLPFGEGPLSVAQAASAGLIANNNFTSAAESAALTINGHDAARVDLRSENSEMIILLIVLDEEQQAWGAVIALCAPGEKADLEPLALGVANSLALQ